MLEYAEITRRASEETSSNAPTMARVLYLHDYPLETASQRAKVYELGLHAGEFHSFPALSDLLRFVSIAGNSDLDLDYPTVCVISGSIGNDNESIDSLSFTQVCTVIEEHYKHLNVLVYEESTLSMSLVRLDVDRYHSLLKNRLVRMKTWAGLNNELAKECPKLYTMANGLHSMLGTSQQKTLELRKYVLMTNQKISFHEILDLKRPPEFYEVCIGAWGFIAHELSCDESTICAYLIFKHAFKALPSSSPLILSDNALLSFLFGVRDSYRGGNAFHNFRHAVDVLQATFFLLIRLGTLPTFAGYEMDIHGAEPMRIPKRERPLLSPGQVLSLLLASVGHDVGHPGLTNDFLSKFNAPMTTVFSSRAVLESFHSAWFQRVLQLHWPAFLEDPWNKLQTETILATDMASHFEYVTKIREMSTNTSAIDPTDQKFTLILMSLIIKCADISNVTRPLDISSRWGVVLTREFAEIAQLSAHLANGDDICSLTDPREEPHFPLTFDESLAEINNLPKNQLYFITNYADAMYKEVAVLFPEFAFMYQVLQSNTAKWESINNS